jgi:NitT/TauT family transport system ATP-binding protein
MTDPVPRPTAPLGQRSRLMQMQGIAKVFNGTVTALRNMNLTVNEGDFISLLGPSGCGKSTALRLIAGLIQPTQGRILWEGGQHAGDLGVVFQEPTLMPWATVARNVYLPFRLRGQSFASVRGDIEDTLALVGLDKFAGAYPRELSGGMKMRVSIARALVTKPRLILMDEPFAALDEITRQRLNDDLLALKSRIGCTVIFVTHSVFESVFLSDRIVVMAARPGRVVEEIEIAAPYPRGMDFRTSADYAARTHVVSDALLQAIGEHA